MNKQSDMRPDDMQLLAGPVAGVPACDLRRRFCRASRAFMSDVICFT